jgi:hypothetical protein
MQGYSLHTHTCKVTVGTLTHARVQFAHSRLHDLHTHTCKMAWRSCWRACRARPCSLLEQSAQAAANLPSNHLPQLHLSLLHSFSCVYQLHTPFLLQIVKCKEVLCPLSGILIGLSFWVHAKRLQSEHEVTIQDSFVRLKAV